MSHAGNRPHVRKTKNMNDKTLDLLTRLADKFGTTVEHLWGVLIKQAAITAVAEIVMAMVMVAAWVWMFRFVRGKTTEKPETNDRYAQAEWEQDGALIAWIVVSIAALITCLQIYEALTTGATALLNPEYWALKQVMP